MSPLILDDASPVARIAHGCDSCGRQIEPGEKYRRQRSISPDGPYTWKACAHCWALFCDLFARDLYFADAARDEYGIGLAEWLEDNPGTTVADLRLTVQFRRRWRDRNGHLYPVPFAGLGAAEGAP